MNKCREIFSNILYISIVIFCTLILVFIIFVIIANIKSFFNIVEIINNIVNQKSNDAITNILSLNVGILQGLTGVIGVGIVIAAYFNFTTIRERLKQTDNKLDKIQKIINEHEEKIKAGFNKDNIASNNTINDINNENISDTKEVNNL